jgi:hypothetical protein
MTRSASGTERNAQKNGKRLCAALVCLLLALSCVAHAADVGRWNEDDNVIERVEKGPSGVEIELSSSRPFPVRALPPVLQVGSSEFSNSFRRSDGDLHTLIFLLTHQEFAQLRSGARTFVVYGRGGAARDRWDFGGFSK